MSGEIDEREWHEFPWEDAPSIPSGQHKKLKLLADANIPKPLIDELRSADLVVDSVVEMGLASHPDENILQLARRLRTVILTMDGDFWDDKKHPLQKFPGVIFIDVPPDHVREAIKGLAEFHALFAKHFPLDWWDQLKAKVSADGFVLKYITAEGKISEDEFRLVEGGKLMTKARR